MPTINTVHATKMALSFKGFGYSLMNYFLRPRSRGRISLASADPLAAPLIDYNYGADEHDLKVLVASIRKSREVFAQEAFAEHARVEMDPGEHLQSDEELLAWVRQNAETAYHPVGSCKMGVDAMAVVDPELRVHGLQGLRVADASIMPTIVGGNTNAASTMIGEKAATMILAASDVTNTPQRA